VRPRPLSSRNMPASANDNRGTVLEEVGADEACLSDLDTVHYPRTCLHPSTLFENRSAGVIGDHCAPSRSSAIGPDSVTSPPSGPPMGDASQWTPFIVGPIKSVAPLKALEVLHRGITDTDADWWTINLVRREALAILKSAETHSLGKAFLVVQKVASAAHQESVVASALRPVELSFAEALGQKAHRQAGTDSWLNKNGARSEFLRVIESEIERPLTPRLQSRLLLSYHKVFGSSAKSGEGLFTSKAHAAFERKGFKRPGKKKPKVPKAMIIDAFVEHENGTATAPTGLPQYVAPPVTSNLCSASRQKPRRRKKAPLNVQAPQAHQHPVYPVEPHQGQFATVANVAQMPGMWYSWCDPRFTCAQNVFYCNDETYYGLGCPSIY